MLASLFEVVIVYKVAAEILGENSFTVPQSLTVSMTILFQLTYHIVLNVT